MHAAAVRLGLSVTQPTKVRTPEFAAELRALDADVAIVIAYGRILPKGVLEAPRLGCLNLHASLLPRWRGAAPINAAILGGDTETGNSVITLADRMDAGLILGTSTRAIDPRRISAEVAVIGA